jgi:DNA polymerase III epsilon subunit family exonuclease
LYTLAERALTYLSEGPRPPLDIAREVLGLARANRVVAERLVLALLGADPRFAFDEEGSWGVRPEPALGRLAPADLPYAVVDVETTGMRARGGDRVTEMAVVHVDGDRSTVAFESLVNPGRPIPPFITRLTGIGDETVADAPRFEEVADRVLAALSGRIFVAHNARFDLSFVRAELERAGDAPFRPPVLDTVRLARVLVPELTRRNLDTVIHWFGISTDRRHRAAGDALATAEVLRRLLDRAAERGVASWHELSAL